MAVVWIGTLLFAPAFVAALVGLWTGWTQAILGWANQQPGRTLAPRLRGMEGAVAAAYPQPTHRPKPPWPHFKEPQPPSTRPPHRRARRPPSRPTGSHPLTASRRRRLPALGGGGPSDCHIHEGGFGGLRTLREVDYDAFFLAHGAEVRRELRFIPLRGIL